MLMIEAQRRDGGSVEFLAAWEAMVNNLSVVFDRNPKYAWIMKQMLEPERTVTFRVAWIDDNGISRVNRGFRVQYSSALGPYVGGTSFTPIASLSSMKADAFNATYSNALTQKNIGGGYGGADFNPYNKSETEIQRFCQSYMTELSKYIGADVDLPGIGQGCAAAEIGYMYGQYKRINQHCGQVGKGLLWGGMPAYQQAHGLGVVYFAKHMLADRKISLEGKRCLITGSNYVALAIAEKLIELGAVPVCFTDGPDTIYEESGFTSAKLKIVQKIKSDRGARVGRYILNSTSAKFNQPKNICEVPCDLVFPCSSVYKITDADVGLLANNGCIGIIEGVTQSLSNSAIANAKKRGLLHAPHRATTVAASLFNGMTTAHEPLQFQVGETLDSRVEAAMRQVYEETKSTAMEFNTRGDLQAGANIAAFLRVADIMLAQGSV